MARTRADHERVVDLVEDQMLLGLDRPNQIINAVNKILEADKAAHLHIGHKRTAQGMMDEVRARWQRRNGDTEAIRKQLLAEAEESQRQSYSILAIARRQNNLTAAVGALRNVEKFQQRRARLLGLDHLKVALGGDPTGAPIAINVELDAARRIRENPEAMARLSAALGALVEGPEAPAEDR
jgi:hypothetical protein